MILIGSKFPKIKYFSINFIVHSCLCISMFMPQCLRSCLSESCARFGRTSARNRAHDMPDDASVNLASVSLASVSQ